MKVLFYVLFCLVSFLSLSNQTIEERIQHIGSIMGNYPDSAISLSHNLLDFAKSEGDDYGIVQANFLLAYIHDHIKINYGKSVIFYLEAIRFAEHSDFEKTEEILISLYKNCGVIFRKFKAYDLAIKYYNNGLSLAHQINLKSQVINITYNIAGMYSEMNRKKEAVFLLESISKTLQPNDKMYFDLNSRLSQIYLDIHEVEKAELLTNSILLNGKPNKSEFINAKQILGRASHILGDVKEAEEHFHIALDTAFVTEKEYSRNKALLETYNDLGLLYYDAEKFESALKYFKLSEEKIEKVAIKQEYLNIFKKTANCLFKLGDFQQAKLYEDKYYQSLNAYLEKQTELQETDRKYNMDLITRRYFDEVAKQERIASILFYSKLISGSLLTLLLLNIGYNRFQKIKIRRDIAKELQNLKITN